MNKHSGKTENNESRWAEIQENKLSNFLTLKIW